MRTRSIGDGRVTLDVSELCLGTMYFGYRTDERTAWAILDRFVEAGGTFLDTANNYGQWHGDAGESERVIGRWMKARGLAGRMVVATKVGARTTKPGDPSPEHWQGLTAKAIREDAETSLRQLGVERLDLYYAHIDDRSTPLEERVEAFGELAQSGKVGLLGASNQMLWRVERTRSMARTKGLPTYSALQQKHTYLLPLPGNGQSNLIGPVTIDYAESEGMALLAYSPLLAGFYARQSTSQLPAEFDHSVNRERLAVLNDVAREHGATPSQVVLRWLMNSGPVVTPIAGASSVEQLDELLGAIDLELDGETMDRLDAAGRTAPEPVTA